MVEQFPSPHSIRLMVWQQQHYNLAQPKRALVKKSPRQIREIRNTNKARKLLASQISKHNKLKTDKKKKNSQAAPACKITSTFCVALRAWSWHAEVPRSPFADTDTYTFVHIYIYVYTHISRGQGAEDCELKTEDSSGLHKSFTFFATSLMRVGLEWVCVCVSARKSARVFECVVALATLWGPWAYCLLLLASFGFYFPFAPFYVTQILGCWCCVGRFLRRQSNSLAIGRRNNVYR